jgi:hypothetical protein
LGNWNTINAGVSWGGVGDTENVIESAGGELLIGHGRSAQQALDAAQFHGEDMDDETANVFGTCDVDLDIQPIAVSLKELAPAASLSVVVVGTRSELGGTPF